MVGAIIGDIVGSPYEVESIKTEDFPLFGKYSQFTDDTVLTIAVADAILSKKSYEDCIREYNELVSLAKEEGIENVSTYVRSILIKQRKLKKITN